MEVQEVFYAIAAFAMGLLSLVLVLVIVTLFVLQKAIRNAGNQMAELRKNFDQSMSSAASKWGTVTLMGVALKILTRLIRR